ncbi:MAG TPA: ABC transporter permease subunit [Isosphaeraceae bacterium]|nr:ABC transporter permease subunit [Isosphaeraceae bacterium]
MLPLAAPWPWGCARDEAGDALARVRRSGKLVFGSDKEGGGPYIYPDPKAPREVAGFEVDLMAELAKGLAPEPVFAQGQWDTLLNVLDGGRIDLVLNGYEWTPNRARDYLATQPYYVFQLQLMAPRGGPIGSWDDLKHPKQGRRPWRIGVLGGSAAEAFARDDRDAKIDVVSFTGATDAMLAVANGQIDATLQDLPAARFYRGQYPSLALVGPPVGHGYYVIYLRKGDEALRDALDRAIAGLVASGRLRQIYQKYDIWTDAQDELSDWSPDRLPASAGRESERGWALVRKYAPLLADASAMTILLSVASMPMAMAIGLLVALGRLYGPRPLRWLLGMYVEFLRGTPLMLQLFVLFYVARLPALVAGIGGLAINYSAYEAEIYRAGLQAIPTGQMEAALALGMSRGLALRRVIIPQAVRLVLPPVTNDFIALFKDTSVCSVITLVELSKQYQIVANATGGVVELAIATATIYLVMSLPLSWFSRHAERRLAKGGAS